MVKVVLFPGGRQTPMRVNLRLTPCGALSRHRCRGVRLRKHARLYYKMPADGPGGRLDLLVDPSSNLSTKYTFLYPGLHLIPRTSLNASTVSRSRALLGGDSILLFLSELVELLMAREFCQIRLQILKIQPMLCCCAVMKKGPATLPNQGGEWEGPRNGENAELKFKGLMDIWTASL